jgi:hypothetical protein
MIVFLKRHTLNSQKNERLEEERTTKNNYPVETA